jgi:sec-independent protein translocase protein TatA
MSAGEIILILFVYLLLFGAKGVPALAQTLGKAVYQFRNAAKDVQNEIMQGANEVRKQTNIRLDQLDLGLDDDQPQTRRPALPKEEPAPPAASTPPSPPSPPSPPTPPSPEG